MRKPYRIHIILSAVLLVILVSCNGMGGRWFPFGNAEEGAKARYTLVFADSIMEVNPDTAYALLHRDSAIISRAGKAERMMYAMLNTQAKDKLYIPHTSDSLMQEVAKYYDKHGTPRQQAQAYYLLGRVCYDLFLTGSSMQAFQDALEVDDDNPVTSRYKGQAAFWLGEFYSDKKLYDKALAYNILSYKFARKSDMSSELGVYALRDIGRAYSNLGNNKHAIGYYKRAAQLAKEMEDMPLYVMVVGELYAIYIEENMLDDAKPLLSLPLEYIPQVDLSPHYNIIGSYYETKEYPDSAIFYYKKSMETGSLESNAMTSLNIAEIYEKQNLYDKAHEYRELNKLYEDSLQRQNKIETSDNIRHIEKNADIQKHNEELTKDRSISNIIICIMIVVVSFAAIATHRYLKEQKRKNEIERKRESGYWKQHYEQKTNKLMQKQGQVKQLNNNQDSISQIIIVTNPTQDKTQANINVVDKTTSLEEFAKSDIYKLFHKAIFKPTENDFIILEKGLNAAYNDFTNRLKQSCPKINLDEIRICCMLKIGLTPKEISIRLSCSFSTVSMKRKRLYWKFFNAEGKAEDFDAFIRTF